MKQLILLVTLLLFISENSFPQSFGIRTGLNFASVKNDFYYNDGFDHIKSNTGFHIGLTGEFLIGENYSLETGMLLTSKGYQYKSSDGYSKVTYTPYYIEVPLNLKVSFRAEKFRFFVFMGPYLAAGAGGSITTNDYNPSNNKQIIDWGNEEDDDFKTWDFGFNLGAGIYLKSFQVSMTYNLGVTNIIPYKFSFDHANHRVFGVSVYYQLYQKELQEH